MKPRWQRERVAHLVYELFDADGKHVYVGMSIRSNFPQRLAAHHGRSWWPLVERVETTEHLGRGVALSFEARLIQKHQPIGNCNHTLRASEGRVA